MSTSNTNSNNDQAGRIKDDGRESRLTFRNFAEHQLRREFRELAMETCDAPIKAFAECGKEHGLMVVFKCREFQADVQECMSVHAGEDAWQVYKEQHKEDLDQRVISSTSLSSRQQQAGQGKN